MQLQGLDQELEEAEEHHVRAHQGHARCMDTLMQLHAARMAFIQQQFDTNVKVGPESSSHTDLPDTFFKFKSLIYCKSGHAEGCVPCCLQALQADCFKQNQEIRAAFSAAKTELGSRTAAAQQHFDTVQADAQLTFETAKAETRNGESEEYNVLKLSLEAQVPDLVHNMPSEKSPV